MRVFVFAILFVFIPLLIGYNAAKEVERYLAWHKRCVEADRYMALHTLSDRWTVGAPVTFTVVCGSQDEYMKAVEGNLVVGQGVGIPAGCQISK